MAEVTQILCPSCHKPNLRRAKFCQHCRSDMVLNNDAPSDERRYVITRVVKQGGQGAVYEGIDESGKVYAIKEMLDRFTDPKEKAEAIERFNEEADLLQNQSHPRIPRVYSHFRDEGRHYLTMDFIRGEDLEQVVDREGRLPEAQVLAWADQICDVLVYLHGKGLIYRDMKPSNVMIERDTGSVKLVDFGITKLFKPTERGTQIGTPGYAPPEQYQGLATPVSDVYALGATLHHLLTGRDPTEQMPFSFPPARDLVPTISERTSNALERALQKVPQDRFATMAEFWAALIPARGQQPGQVRVAQPTTKIPQPAAAQVGAAPPISGTAAPPRPARQPNPPTPTQPAPRQAPAQKQVPTARPAPPRPSRQRQGRGFLGTLQLLLTWTIALAVVATLAVGAYALYARPSWAAPLIDLVPTAAPTPAPALSSHPVSYELEVTVPAGSEQTTILAALRVAFEAAAQAEFGPSTRVNPNVQPSTVGSPQLVNEANGLATYRATVSGFIYRP